MLISIIIPVYNHARTLRRVLASVQQQTATEKEVIIVNDGSTDNFDEAMQEILTRVEFKDLSIKVITQANAGAPVARNRGFRESRGELVIFWDADTVARPTMLEKMSDALVNNPKVAYAYSGFKFGWKKFWSIPFSADKLRQMNYIDVTSLIRRADFPGFDESLKKFQDWDLWLTLLTHGKTGVYVPEILYQKITRGRAGISSWLPSFFYRLPVKTRAVREYEEGRKIIAKKHIVILNEMSERIERV